mmetsp:Transcript_22230/g.69180  ORF Transcript_22230/g.69180 Transcript_22230/m.69180 type:complete len:245 (+) Transcript_22230:284-1018(+)|eukprot:CAMPEP_0182853892 /NCGR_PEP_ID=MMETSP0034_2-20130328/945_1 /TAXON_ID=156128 /ORGANISM="Nephroselmis pyriformis, Strain CCMP717" /LENGTH=244 /DNA_ID=CAMNT_0024984677 /DNA_START=253 /DNA_END=987 /DNA_ORIENTATION=+
MMAPSLAALAAQQALVPGHLPLARGSHLRLLERARGCAAAPRGRTALGAVRLLAVRCDAQRGEAPPPPRAEQRIGGRRMALLGAVSAASAAVAPKGALADNAEVLRALQQRNEQKVIEDFRKEPTDLSRRFRLAMTQLDSIQRLGEIGQYEDARQQLRKGAFSSLRKDLLETQRVLALERVSFDRFEGLALVGATEALDATLKEGYKGAGTDREAVRRSCALVREALDEVIRLLPAPPETYEEQ